MCPRPDYWPKDAKTHIERAGHAGAKDVRVRWAPPVAEGSKFGFDLVTVRFEIHWT
jgi:hypothetical protein